MMNANNGGDFSTLARKIKSGIDRNTGDSISSLRKTKGGGLLIKVRGDQAVVDIVKVETVKAAGSDVTVRQLQQRTLIEIRDIDAWSDREDIISSISSERTIHRDAIKVISLRTLYCGTQSTLVLLSTDKAREILKNARLRVGVVSYRVRVVEKRRTRCFRCVAFAHESKGCKGVDWSRCCRRCGQNLHFAKDCVTDAFDAATFAKVLQGKLASNVEEKENVMSNGCGSFPTNKHEQKQGGSGASVMHTEGARGRHIVHK